MFKTFFQSHISQLSCLLTSSFFKVYDSAPYRTVLQMTAFLILFFRQRLKAFDISSFFLVNVCNRRAQILFPSVLHDNSLVTWWSLVNMRAGVTIACGTIELFISKNVFPSSQSTYTYHISHISCQFISTIWQLFFGGHDTQTWKKTTFGLCWRLACAWVVAHGWLRLKFGSSLKVFSFEGDFWKP